MLETLKKIHLTMPTSSTQEIVKSALEHLEIGTQESAVAFFSTPPTGDITTCTCGNLADLKNLHEELTRKLSNVLPPPPPPKKQPPQRRKRGQAHATPGQQPPNRIYKNKLIETANHYSRLASAMQYGEGIWGLSDSQSTLFAQSTKQTPAASRYTYVNEENIISQLLETEPQQNVIEWMFQAMNSSQMSFRSKKQQDGELKAKTKTNTEKALTEAMVSLTVETVTKENIAGAHDTLLKKLGDEASPYLDLLSKILDAHETPVRLLIDEVRTTLTLFNRLQASQPGRQ